MSSKGGSKASNVVASTKTEEPSSSSGGLDSSTANNLLTRAGLGNLSSQRAGVLLTIAALFIICVDGKNTLFFFFCHLQFFYIS